MSFALPGWYQFQHRDAEYVLLSYGEAVEIVCKFQRACVAFPYLGFGLFFLPQCAQHAMRQDQVLNLGVGGDLADYRWRHVEAALDTFGALGDGVVGDEEIGVGGEARKA